jgi:hypothetical protein
MGKALRTILAILGGLASALALVVAVEAASAVVHPTPPDFTGTKEEMCEHVARYPQWVLAAVVVLWNLTGLVGVAIATQIGNRLPGIIVGTLLYAALAANVAMLPYPLWFKLAMLVTFPPICWWGVRRAERASQLRRNASAVAE